MLPINFHSQLCKLSPLLPSQSSQHRLGVVSRAVAVVYTAGGASFKCDRHNSYIDFEGAFC